MLESIVFILLTPVAALGWPFYRLYLKLTGSPYAFYPWTAWICCVVMGVPVAIALGVGIWWLFNYHLVVDVSWH